MKNTQTSPKKTSPSKYTPKRGGMPKKGGIPKNHSPKKYSPTPKTITTIKKPVKRRQATVMDSTMGDMNVIMGHRNTQRERSVECKICLQSKAPYWQHFGKMNTYCPHTKPQSLTCPGRAFICNECYENMFEHANTNSLEMRCPFCKHTCKKIPRLKINILPPGSPPTTALGVMNRHIESVHYPDANEAGWNPEYHHGDRLPYRQHRDGRLRPPLQSSYDPYANNTGIGIQGIGNGYNPAIRGYPERRGGSRK